MWVTFVGDVSVGPTYQDAGILNDAVATWRVHRASGVDPNLITIVYPSTQSPRPLPPPDAAASSLYASANDLPNLFHPDGQITKRFRQRVGGNPDIVVIHWTGHGSSNGDSTWGNETINLADLQNILERLHAAYGVPVVLIADRCNAGAVKVIINGFKQESWRKDTYIIMASLSGQFAWGQQFSDAWKYKDILWPAAAQIPGLLDHIGSAFEQNKVYGRLTTNLLVWPAAPDYGGNGVDAADLCQFLKNAEINRRQPPINALPNTLVDVDCDSGAMRDPDPSKWAPRFAFTVPTVTIDLDENEPPFYANNKAKVPFRDLVSAFEDTLRARAAALGYPASGLLINRCKGKKCDHEWSCSINWEQRDQQDDYRAQCEHRRRGQIVPTATTPSSEDLKRKLALVAERVLVPPWFPQSKTTTNGPLVEVPTAYAVALDRSDSMMTNDPDRRKTRLFFDTVIQPALTRGQVRRLLVASFADDVRLLECFNRKHGGDVNDVNQARRCFMREAVPGGLTNLIGGMDRLVGELGRSDAVWILTDGVQSVKITDCPQDTRAKYVACLKRRIVDVGRRLASDRRSVFALFLKGTVGNEDMVKQIGQIRDQADTGRYVVLDNEGNFHKQEQDLIALGQSAIQRSIATLPLPEHQCGTSGVNDHCHDTLNFEVGPNSSELRIHWRNLIVDKLFVHLQSGGPNGQGFGLATGNPSATSQTTGVTVGMAMTDGVTTISWTVPQGRKLTPTQWTIEIDYDVTGVDQ